ncbi:hypothetical protein M8C21_003175, partial [Ambrosia artemisiifolia]
FHPQKSNEQGFLFIRYDLLCLSILSSEATLSSSSILSTISCVHQLSQQSHESLSANLAPIDLPYSDITQVYNGGADCCGISQMAKKLNKSVEGLNLDFAAKEHFSYGHMPKKSL